MVGEVQISYLSFLGASLHCENGSSSFFLLFFLPFFFFFFELEDEVDLDLDGLALKTDALFGAFPSEGRWLLSIRPRSGGS